MRWLDRPHRKFSGRERVAIWVIGICGSWMLFVAIMLGVGVFTW